MIDNVNNVDAKYLTAFDLIKSSAYMNATLPIAQLNTLQFDKHVIGRIVARIWCYSMNDATYQNADFISICETLSNQIQLRSMSEPLSALIQRLTIAFKCLPVHMQGDEIIKLFLVELISSTCSSEILKFKPPPPTTPPPKSSSSNQLNSALKRITELTEQCDTLRKVNVDLTEQNVKLTAEISAFPRRIELEKLFKNCKKIQIVREQPSSSKRRKVEIKTEPIG